MVSAVDDGRAPAWSVRPGAAARSVCGSGSPVAQPWLGQSGALVGAGAGCLGPVGFGWGDDVGGAVNHDEFVAAAVHVRMMKRAHQHCVIGIGHPGQVTLVTPGLYMMCLTPRRWPAATRHDTAAGTCRESPVLRRSEQAFRFTVLQHPALMHQRRDQITVTEQLIHR